MPGSLRNWLGLALIAGLALVPVALAAALVVFVGFAWALIACAALGVAFAHFMPTGSYGEGSFVTAAVWILLAFGLAVGLFARLLFL